MTHRDKTIVMVVAALVIIALGCYLLLPGAAEAGRIQMLDGQITWLDYETREVSLEFIHPRSGKLREFTHAVPEECAILIEGEVAKLTDLRAGDQVLVEGMRDRGTKAIRVLTITLVERPLAESEPADESAPATGSVE